MSSQKVVQKPSTSTKLCACARAHTHTQRQPLACSVSQLSESRGKYFGNYPLPPVGTVKKAMGLLPEVCNLKQMTAGPSPDASGLWPVTPMNPLSTVRCQITAALTSWLAWITFNCRATSQRPLANTILCYTIREPLLHPPHSTPPLYCLYLLVFLLFPLDFSFLVIPHYVTLCYYSSFFTAHRQFFKPLFELTKVYALFYFMAAAHHSE